MESESFENISEDEFGDKIDPNDDGANQAQAIISALPLSLKTLRPDSTTRAMLQILVPTILEVVGGVINLLIQRPYSTQ